MRLPFIVQRWEVAVQQHRHQKPRDGVLYCPNPRIRLLPVNKYPKLDPSAFLANPSLSIVTTSGPRPGMTHQQRIFWASDRADNGYAELVRASENASLSPSAGIPILASLLFASRRSFETWNLSHRSATKSPSTAESVFMITTAVYRAAYDPYSVGSLQSASMDDSIPLIEHIIRSHAPLSSGL